MLHPQAANSSSVTSRSFRLRAKLLAALSVGMACFMVAFGVQPPSALLVPLVDSSEHRMELDANERLVASVRSTRRTKCKTVPTGNLPPTAKTPDSSTTANRSLADRERHLPSLGDRLAPLRC